VFLVGILVLVAVTLAIAGVDIASPGTAARLALWISAVAAYGFFWFAVAVAVAAAGRPSSTNATILAGIWLALVVLMPSIVNLAATTMYPVPSRVEMIQAMRVASDQANEQGSKLLAKYYEDHPELVSGDAQQAMNDFNVVRVAVSAEVERSVAQVLERFSQQLDGQRRIVELARFLSPAILIQDALNDAAGTGSRRHRQFTAQVEAYHERWREYFVRLIFSKSQLEDFSDIPLFTWAEETTASVFQRVVKTLVGLLAPACIVAILGLAALRRYSVAE
jgi:ABC-2 type transport system permease protein